MVQLTDGKKRKTKQTKNAMTTDCRFSYGLYNFDNISQVDVRTSTIKGAGKGVFLKNDVSAYSILTFYSGEVLPYDPIGCDDNECMYDVLIGNLKGGVYKCTGFKYQKARNMSMKQDADGSGIMYNVGQLCNDPRDKRVNAEMAIAERSCIPEAFRKKSVYIKYSNTTRQYHYIDIPVVFIYSLRPMKNGEEVFICYGSKYW